MLMPMLGFMVVYLAIVLVSAGYFASAYRLDAVGAFGTEAKDVHPGFWDFAYLSLMTITTLGYSDLRPSSAATKLVASLEVAAGIGWLAVGLAGIIAYLDRRFDQVSKAQARRPPGRRRKPAQKRPLPKGPDVSASANDRRSGSERSTVG